MITYYIIFFLAFGPGILLADRRQAITAERSMLWCGYALIILFGARITALNSITNTLGNELIAAGAIAVAAVCGSLLVTALLLIAVSRLVSVPKNSQPTRPSHIAVEKNRPWLNVTVSLGLLILGICIGMIQELPGMAVLTRLFLYLMIASVGFLSGTEVRGMLTDGGAKNISRQSLLLFTCLPVAVIGGTLAGAAGVGIFLHISWEDSMLCAAPLGWQTLGGPLILELRGPRLGTVAFLANMFRDIIALITIPMVARGRWRLLGTVPGGVSTMDILLPTVVASSGRENLVYAMWVGACCSFWAPVLIYAIAWSTGGGQ